MSEQARPCRPADFRARALELHEEGYGYTRIARALGISRTSVIRYVRPDYEARSRQTSRAAKQRRRGRCIECGAETAYSGHSDSRTSLRCGSCAVAMRTVWTEESVIEAIRFYADMHGHPPAARDWHPPLARQKFRDDIAEKFYEDACWPSYGRVCEIFGSWNAAIRAAGFAPLRPGHKWSASYQEFEAPS